MFSKQNHQYKNDFIFKINIIDLFDSLCLLKILISFVLQLNLNHNDL
jgi:hypothetical protein